MPHKKLAIPKCLYCGKRLTPLFKFKYTQSGWTKIGIWNFGKVNTDDMLCSDQCGVQLTKTIIMNPDKLQFYLNLREHQLLDCYQACVERGYLIEAKRYLQNEKAQHIVTPSE